MLQAQVGAGNGNCTRKPRWVTGLGAGQEDARNVGSRPALGVMLQIGWKFRFHDAGGRNSMRLVVCDGVLLDNNMSGYIRIGAHDYGREEQSGSVAPVGLYL